jgi:hypothetical protein
VTLGQLQHHVHVRYPLRLRRARKDIAWLRAEAIKKGVDPDAFIRSL